MHPNRTRESLELLEKGNEEAKKLSREADKLRDELNRTRAAGGSVEAVKKLKDQLEIAEAKVKELGERPPEATPTVVERTPDDVLQLVEDLRQQKQTLESKLAQSSNPAMAKYRAYFEATSDNFGKLLGALAEIREHDKDAYEKYRLATVKMIDTMNLKL